MGRLVVVSNRVASPNVARAGGLAVGLHAALREGGGLWFGWSGRTTVEPLSPVKVISHAEYDLATTDLVKADYQDYYNGFSNRTLWPLLHGRIDLTTFELDLYRAYRRVNRIFAERLLPLMKSDDIVWVHDYHLMAMGQELAASGVQNPLGFFLHVPFPPGEIFSALPWHDEIARAMMAFDLIGFQTERDQRNFRDYVHTELGGGVGTDNMLVLDGRRTRTGVFPIGIDTDEFARTGAADRAGARIARICEGLRGRSTILGVDRLDYTKGLVERMLAFETLLEGYPKHRGRVCLVQIAAPSRERLPEYCEIRNELERVSGRINARFGELDFTPVHYRHRPLARNQLAALYRHCRVGLVTPLRDGMNLVAKEYVASQDPPDPGVLVLSRFAGAAEQMDGALIVNPYDPHTVAATLNRALEMPLAERIARFERMMATLQRFDIHHWWTSFVSHLNAQTERRTSFQVA